jgi:hypothetical protein
VVTHLVIPGRAKWLLDYCVLVMTKNHLVRSGLQALLDVIHALYWLLGGELTLLGSMAHHRRYCNCSLIALRRLGSSLISWPRISGIWMSMELP